MVPESLLILYNMEDKRNGRSRIDPELKMLPVDNREVSVKQMPVQVLC